MLLALNFLCLSTESQEIGLKDLVFILQSDRFEDANQRLSKNDFNFDTVVHNQVFSQASEIQWIKNSKIAVANGTLGWIKLTSWEGDYQMISYQTALPTVYDLYLEDIEQMGFDFIETTFEYGQVNSYYESEDYRFVLSTAKMAGAHSLVDSLTVYLYVLVEKNSAADILGGN